MRTWAGDLKATVAALDAVAVMPYTLPAYLAPDGGGGGAVSGVMVKWTAVAPGAVTLSLGKKISTWPSSVLTVPSLLTPPSKMTSPLPAVGRWLEEARSGGGET